MIILVQKSYVFEKSKIHTSLGQVVNGHIS
jgi:hypothetical protein